MPDAATKSVLSWNIFQQVKLTQVARSSDVCSITDAAVTCAMKAHDPWDAGPQWLRYVLQNVYVKIIYVIFNEIFFILAKLSLR